MKLLLFSDLHRDTHAARDLVRMAEQADVIVGAGDYATVHHGLEDVIAVLRAIDKPTVLVAGNNETPQALAEACVGWHNVWTLHAQEAVIDRNTYFGLAGGVPITPFGSWSFDLSEDDAGAILERCPAGAVLVSHSPPSGAVDVGSTGQSLGSTAVRDAIERTAPRLVVCGHIHASADSIAHLGKTPVVNAGPKGVLWDLDAGERIA